MQLRHTPIHPRLPATVSMPMLGIALLCTSAAAVAATKIDTTDLSPLPPPDLCTGLARGTERKTIKPVAKPPFGRFFREPAFGTRVGRITNSPEGAVSRPAGNPVQAWNADESLLLLFRHGLAAGPVLHDGSDYKYIGPLDIDVQPDDAVHWSRTHADQLYYVSAGDRDDSAPGRLIRYDVRSGEATTLTDFTPACEKAGLSAGGGTLSPPSADGDLFGFTCKTSGERSLAIGYRLSSDASATLRLNKDGAFTPDSAPIPVNNGRNFWLQGVTLDERLENAGSLMDMADAVSNVSVGQSSDGHDTVYQVAYEASPKGCARDMWDGIGHLITHPLMIDQNAGKEAEQAALACRSIISQTDGYPDTTAGTDVFASAWKRPGWVMMSSVGYGDFDWFSNNQRAPQLFSELYLVDTGPKDARVCRMAHHRSYAKTAKNGGYEPALGEPGATSSPSGTRVVFASDWYDSGSVDTYVVELPAYARISLAGNWADRAADDVLTRFVQTGDDLLFDRQGGDSAKGTDFHFTGEGSIKRHKAKLVYETLTPDEVRISGRCEGTLARDKQSILFNCYDAYYGGSTIDLVRH